MFSKLQTLLTVVPLAVAAPLGGSNSARTTTGKRGLAYNDVSLLSNFTSSDYVSWVYNWGQTTTTLPSSEWEYVPMLWGTSTTWTDTWTASAKEAIAAGSTHLLAFNEPDLSSQSDLTVAEAVAGYQTYMNPFAGLAELGAPVVTNGASPMGLTYLSNFLDQCTNCTVDFIPIHWYDSASNTAYFKSYVEEAIELADGKPVWITEFGATGTDDEVAAFLEEVMPWLDALSGVDRYAYFMVSDGILVDGTSLSSPIGSTYASYE